MLIEDEIKLLRTEAERVEEAARCFMRVGEDRPEAWFEMGKAAEICKCFAANRRWEADMLERDEAWGRLFVRGRDDDQRD